MITSASNDKIKKIAAYNAKNRLRKEDKVFIVEGIRMQVEIPSDLILETYVSESFLSKASEKDMEYLNSLPLGYEEVSDQVFKKMSDTKAPQGVLSLVRQLEYTDEDLFAPAKNRDGSSTDLEPLILILEGIQDPGNLGTIFRSAEGSGVTGIYMSSDCADVYNSKVVRSTMGAIFRQPFKYSENLLDTISMLKEKGIVSYAAHLKGKKNYDELDFKKGTAFLIGNEGNGLSKEISDAADEYLLIPMLGQVESMNAATSAAILGFEAARQRRI
ncbi:MAG: RNA methyltransferase [Butyrivibrio sp.]|uniref:TrmH family RNA methyltransferase n=1 Tax=Butyrivibrio sp. TaxID=28121 RepID=UPI0025EA2E30|nr:RNA methyltransferase [Butyrivibrio sp.]MCR5769596.1 RNA methyltransferase [Butyrivibrio sp.]